MMFFNYIKNRALKKGLRLSLNTPLNSKELSSIKTVGVLLSYKDLDVKAGLLRELQARGIAEESVFFLVYKGLKSSETPQQLVVSYGDFSNSAVLGKESVQAFLDRPLDLLISYYDVENPLLSWLSSRSQAKFKAGFSTVKKNTNHINIQLATERYKDYIEELFRYIEIFKN